jgi:dienelactone hydrolase
MEKVLSPLFAATLLLAPAACKTSESFLNARLDANDRDQRQVSGLLSKPEREGRLPAVVLLYSCGGMTPHVTSAWSSYLNGLGYVTLTVDTFGSRGHVNCRGGNPLGFSDVDFTKDAYGALDHLAKQPYVDKDRIAVMGFSLGAKAINGILIPWRVRAAGGLDFKAAIAFYGNCHGIGQYPEESIPLMQILGEEDHNLVAGCLNAARYAPEIEVHVLPGAHHAFDSRRASGKVDIGGNYMEYSAGATEAAKALTRAFLERRLAR